MFIAVKSPYVCGIDLHARTMSVCVMDKNGSILMRKSIPCKLSALLAILKPWRKSITVGVESTYNWYWLVDGLKAHGIACHLGHALYISRMSSSKHKSDPVDAHGIAELLRTGGRSIPLPSNAYSLLRATVTLDRVFVLARTQPFMPPRHSTFW
jgi:transposase